MTLLSSNPQDIHSAEFYGLDLSTGIASVSKAMSATVDLRYPAYWFLDSDKVDRSLGSVHQHNKTLHQLFLFGLYREHSWLIKTASAKGSVIPLAVGLEGKGYIRKNSILSTLLVALVDPIDAGGSLEILTQLPANSTSPRTRQRGTEDLTVAQLHHHLLVATDCL